MAQETKKKPMLGEVLIEHGIITASMLKNALKKQSQVGGKIGSILVEMGYISIDTLLEFLSQHFDIPATNLIKIDIPADVLRALPLDKIKAYKVLPLKVDDQYTLAMVNPNDFMALSEIQFILGRGVKPVVVASLQIEAALKNLQPGTIKALKGSDIEKQTAILAQQAAPDIRPLLKLLSEANATDMQLTAGVPPAMKMRTELHRLNMQALTPGQMTALANGIMPEEQRARFQTSNDLDFAITDLDYGRFRVNIYRQRGSVSMTLRHIPDKLSSINDLGLPEDLEGYALKSQGLILITGPAGHGKSTTMAAMVDLINKKRKCNIVSLEDPIEYLHVHKNSNVNQREIGLDTESFYEGLKRVFRQGPDVIVVGEMRDPDSFMIALQAAETGHLVLSTMHARNSTSTVERVVDMFPSHQQAQARNQLADSLLLVLAQRLVLKKDKSGPILAYERLINTYKIKNFIRDSKTHQIRTQMQIPGEDYSSIDVSLARLCLDGKITAEEGAKHADNLSFYQEMIKGKGTK
ncbi:MAG: PilT/PilU family type 4a pilus ATPase [Nitrospirae bacterium]|nr:PilT/PilU family type 4a pilus ATPase [Nitrospirota bacterium]